MTEEQQVRRWAPLAYRIAAGFYLPGADWEDVRQEALLGLLEAVRTHDPARGELGLHAAAVIRRRLVDAVIAARRGRRLILTDAARVVDDRPAGGDVFALADARDELRGRLASLSPLELGACVGSAAGFSYVEIAGRLGVGVKQVDNAAQRARVKLRAAA